MVEAESIDTCHTYVDEVIEHNQEIVGDIDEVCNQYVEDEKDLNELVKSYLEQAGYEVRLIPYL